MGNLRQNPAMEINIVGVFVRNPPALPTDAVG
jgi:hypothetical protein